MFACTYFKTVHIFSCMYVTVHKNKLVCSGIVHMRSVVQYFTTECLLTYSEVVVVVVFVHSLWTFPIIIYSETR